MCRRAGLRWPHRTNSSGSGVGVDEGVVAGGAERQGLVVDRGQERDAGPDALTFAGSFRVEVVGGSGVGPPHRDRRAGRFLGLHSVGAQAAERVGLGGVPDANPDDRVRGGKRGSTSSVKNRSKGPPRLVYPT